MALNSSRWLFHTEINTTVDIQLVSTTIKHSKQRSWGSTPKSIGNEGNNPNYNPMWENYIIHTWFFNVCKCYRLQSCFQLLYVLHISSFQTLFFFFGVVRWLESSSHHNLGTFGRKVYGSISKSLKLRFSNNLILHGRKTSMKQG